MEPSTSPYVNIRYARNRPTSIASNDTAPPTQKANSDNVICPPSTSTRRKRRQDRDEMPILVQQQQPKPPSIQEFGREIEVGSNGIMLEYSRVENYRNMTTGFRDVMDQHAYAHHTEVTSTVTRASSDWICDDERCKYNKFLSKSYAAKIADLDSRIDAQKREQQCLALKLRESQMLLKEREVQSSKCVQCQRITELYHQSSTNSKQMEQRLVTLGLERFNYERQLCKLYGENRARIMVKLLMEQEEGTAPKRGKGPSQGETGLVLTINPKVSGNAHAPASTIEPGEWISYSSA